VLFTLPLRAGAATCADCNGDGVVTISELVTGINIALGGAELSACVPIDRDTDGSVTIDELVAAIMSALYGCPTASTPTATMTSQLTRSTTPTETPSPTSTVGAGNQTPPTGEDALIAWLQAGSYLTWPAESGPHASAGPHFGTVRAFVNDALFSSLSANDTQHPVGAAAVKELYGRTGSTVRGWAVMLKVQDDSDDGRGWYWYETFNGSGGGGVGDPVCTGCHSVGRDFVRIPFPLQ
jgi:hypothetical protein